MIYTKIAIAQLLQQEKEGADPKEEQFIYLLVKGL